LSDETQPQPPAPMVIECAICQDELTHPAQRWEHTHQPADGHRPQPVERKSE